MMPTPVARSFLVLGLLGILLPAGGSLAQDSGGRIIEEAIDPYTWEPADDSVAVDAETVDLPQVFADLGPVASTWYQHVLTLSGPFFEGRAPGSDGIDRAAEYVEFWFQRNGLEPAFGPGNGEEASYRQWLTVPGGKTRIDEAAMAFENQPLEVGRDFAVFGNSGSGEVEAPLAFAGYAIPEGPDEFSSFGGPADLSGRIVVVFRYEPLDENGRSRFSRRRFSAHAAIRPKLEAVVERGAAGIMLVNPPGSLFGKPGLEAVSGDGLGAGMPVPVVQVTENVANRMLEGADPEGRSLADLRRIADEGDHGAVLFDPARTCSITTLVSGGPSETANIGGILRGRGDLADEWIVLGAHYDHVGMGTFGSMPGNRGRLHPGADDNASGTSTVIVLADLLGKAYASMPDDVDRRSILFLAFTAEESGLIGSRYFVQNPFLPAQSVNAMINLDMVGRLRSDTIAIGGFDSAEGFLEDLRPELEKSGMTIHADPNPRGPSDHASFFGAGIPVLFFYTGTHEDYHAPGDKGWTVNPAGGAKVVSLVEGITMHMATDPERLVFASGRPGRVVRGDAEEQPQAAAGNDRGYAPVRLGIRPGMTDENEPGVRVESVSPGTSAELGGIKGGDFIIAWGGEDLVGIMDMVERLRTHRPGDKVKMVVIRDGEEVELEIVFQASSQPSSD
ncbi:MAG: M28 family peptidase [Phycisphaerales bacterium]|nr:M28 family peptidase [Phycisphaerales bacterium]